MDLATVPSSAPETVCLTHPGVAVGTFCSTCVGAYCSVCLFTTPDGAACPECALRPAAGGGQGRATAYGIASMVSSVLGVALFIAMSVSPDAANPGVGAQALGLISLSATVGGVAFALVARDHTRQRSPLLLVALILSSVLLALYVAVTIIGNAAS
jgi:hypothetical protein